MKEKKAARSTATNAKVYSWVPGSRFGRELDVTVIGPELNRLIETHGQKLAAETVVTAAASPLNPLHPAFEWDDTRAAQAHRIAQAQHLLRSVQITIATPTGGEITTRATVTRERHGQPGKRYYSTTEYALSDTEIRAEVLKQALREAVAFRRKYADLSELTQVFAVIDRVAHATPQPHRRKRQQGVS
jgi:hypothetical protein